MATQQQTSPLSALLKPNPPSMANQNPSAAAAVSPLGALLKGGGGGYGGGGAPAAARDNRHMSSAVHPPSHLQQQQQQQQPSYSNRNATTFNNCDIRGRPAAGLKEASAAAAPSSAAFGAVGGGGYNFQSAGGSAGYDRFEHYRRPPSRPASREQSVDRLHAEPSATASGRVSRPPSRNRTPMQRPPSTAGVAADDFALKANGGISNREASVGGGLGLRHRQTSGSRPGSGFAQHEPASPPSSSAAIGAIPKRTESLYMKIPEGAAPPAAGSKVEFDVN